MKMRNAKSAKMSMGFGFTRKILDDGRGFAVVVVFFSTNTSTISMIVFWNVSVSVEICSYSVHALQPSQGQRKHNMVAELCSGSQV